MTKEEVKNLKKGDKILFTTISGSKHGTVASKRTYKGFGAEKPFVEVRIDFTDGDRRWIQSDMMDYFLNCFKIEV